MPNTRSLTRVPQIVRWMTWISVCGALTASIVLGQVATGEISGIVRDASGASIPSVAVTATNRDTGLVRTTQSSQDGRYLLPALPAGTYDLKAEAVSFRSEVHHGLTLTVAQNVVSNFALTAGAVQENGHGGSGSSSCGNDRREPERTGERAEGFRASS